MSAADEPVWVHAYMVWPSLLRATLSTPEKAVCAGRTSIRARSRTEPDCASADSTRPTGVELAAGAPSRYLALAPDLFDGRSWIRCIRSAFAQLRAGHGRAFAALDAASRYLAARPDCTGKTGVIGFCLGGSFALLCAPRPGFAVAAVNYGVVPKDADSVLAGACPVVASYGGRDPMGAQHPERLKLALSVLDIAHDVRVYPGAGHRFMTDATGASAIFAKIAGMSYRPEDAADAWARLYGFFGAYLAGDAAATA